MSVAGHNFTESSRVLPTFAHDVHRASTSSLAADLTYALGILRSRRGLIFTIVALSLFAAFAYIWTASRYFASAAEILIDPRRQEIVKDEILPSGMGSSSLGADTFLLDSQVQVILSDGVLRKLIAVERLDEDEELAGLGGSETVKKIKSVLKFILMGPKAAALAEPTPVERVLKSLDKALHVTREGNTYVLKVEMTSKDPVKSARIANALVSIYVNQIAEDGRKRIKDVEAVLTGRLEELRVASADARQKVEAFRAENGLLASDKITVIEQQLRDLNQQYSAAVIGTSRAEARWNEVSKMSKLSFETALATGSVQSNLLSALQDRYAAATAQEASLATGLKNRHPSLAAARTAKDALRKEIKAELTRLVGRAKIEYEIAVANEAALRAHLADLKKLTAETNSAAVTLKALEQQAEAAAAIYNQFLTRAKDAREQIAIPVDSIRMISRAEPATRPSWPVEPLILGFALFLGLALSVTLAIILHVVKGPPAPTAAL